jgi:cellobiose phosphorylase
MKFNNGYGYFSDDGQEYIITNPKTPAPWVNILSNGKYTSIMSQSGTGMSWADHAAKDRITRWHMDFTTEDRGKFIYIKNINSGKLYSASFKPVCHDYKNYICRFGIGYIVIEQEFDDFKTSWTMVVHPSKRIEMWKLDITNLGSAKNTFDITSLVEWNLGVDPFHHREFHKGFFQTGIIKNKCTWASKRAWLVPSPKGHINTSYRYIGFHSVSEDPERIYLDKRDLLGLYGNYQSPEFHTKNLKNENGSSRDRIAGLNLSVSVKAGKTKSVIFLLGAAKKMREIEKFNKKYLSIPAFEKVMKKNKIRWNKLLSNFDIETPDESFNFLFNTWIIYQVFAARFFAKGAYYFQGGAYGYREIQDILISLPIDIEYSKYRLLINAKNQYKDGTVPHDWDDLTGHRGGTTWSDDPLWLAYYVCHYIKETGDWSILDEKIAYLDGGADSLLRHCIRAIDYVRNGLSPKGLPLIKQGDWNDGMSATGIEMKGESVWLAHFLYLICTEFEPILIKKNMLDILTELREVKQNLKSSINGYAWDGQWYIRAFTDSGKPVGSKNSKGAIIFANAQSWAILAETITEERLEGVLKSLEKYIYSEYGPLLLYPAYEEPDSEIGYLTRYNPGVRENGGIYFHAANWSIMAEAKLKRKKIAWDLFDKINPIKSCMEPDRYCAEPYVTCGNIEYKPSPEPGRGGWTWYTGSAAWFFYAAISYLLGIRAGYTGLIIEPCVPESWKSFKVKRMFRGCTYNITFKYDESIENISITVDGKKIHGNLIVPSKKKEAEVEVLYK